MHLLKAFADLDKLPRAVQRNESSYSIGHRHESHHIFQQRYLSVFSSVSTVLSRPLYSADIITQHDNEINLRVISTTR